MYLDLIDETNRLSQEHIKLVEEILFFSSNYLKLSDNVECCVTFVDNKRIQTINREYRFKDYPTDVISFAMDDEVADEITLNFDVDNLTHHLGDIIISVDKVIEQSEEYNHSFERELGFLAIHGFLHLNGYDHMNEIEEKEMFDLQNNILQSFGLGRI